MWSSFFNRNTEDVSNGTEENGQPTSPGGGTSSGASGLSPTSESSTDQLFPSPLSRQRRQQIPYVMMNQGDIGPPGPAGPEGPPGPAGPEGRQGPQGRTGLQGRQGARGSRGATGPPGPKGDRGAPGRNGVPGPRGCQGPRGDIGPQGRQGDMGAQGPRGDIGPQGPQGVQGLRGPRGPRGNDGDIGPQGRQGDMGAQGPRGDIGPQGPQGPPGPPGPRGPRGNDGPPGPQGPGGNDGPPGPQGPRGYDGARGPKGNDGPPGRQGSPGRRGPRGHDGREGPQGRRGPQGERGGVRIHVFSTGDHGYRYSTHEVPPTSSSSPIPEFTIRTPPPRPRRPSSPLREGTSPFEARRHAPGNATRSMPMYDTPMYTHSSHPRGFSVPLSVPKSYKITVVVQAHLPHDTSGYSNPNWGGLFGNRRFLQTDNRLAPIARRVWSSLKYATSIDYPSNVGKYCSKTFHFKLETFKTNQLCSMIGTAVLGLTFGFSHPIASGFTIEEYLDKCNKTDEEKDNAELMKLLLVVYCETLFKTNAERNKFYNGTMTRSRANMKQCWKRIIFGLWSNEGVRRIPLSHTTKKMCRGQHYEMALMWDRFIPGGMKALVDDTDPANTPNYLTPDQATDVFETNAGQRFWEYRED